MCTKLLIRTYGHLVESSVKFIMPFYIIRATADYGATLKNMGWPGYKATLEPVFYGAMLKNMGWPGYKATLEPVYYRHPQDHTKCHEEVPYFIG